MKKKKLMETCFFKKNVYPVLKSEKRVFLTSGWIPSKASLRLVWLCTSVSFMTSLGQNVIEGYLAWNIKTLQLKIVKWRLHIP